MSEQVVESFPRYVHFSVEGSFITNLAREKFFINKDLAGALELLRSALVSDQLDSDEQLMLCMQILNGDAEIVGNSDNDDYGVDFREDIEERPTNLESIGQLIADMKAENERLIRENHDLMCKVGFLGGELSDYRLRELNGKYYEETGETLFSGVSLPAWATTDITYVEDDDASDMVESYLEQRRREQEAVENDEEPVCDYGWLEPDGTFHEVPWGNHSGWAKDYLEEHYPFKDNPDLYWRVDSKGIRHSIFNGDVLVYSLGWILIDSPFQGLPKMTRDTSREMTKAQKEFMFDFFMERGRTEEANALYAD